MVYFQSVNEMKIVYQNSSKMKPCSLTFELYVSMWFIYSRFTEFILRTFVHFNESLFMNRVNVTDVDITFGKWFPN